MNVWRCAARRGPSTARVDLGDVLRREVLALALSAGRAVLAVARDQVGRAADGRGERVVVAPRILGRRRRTLEVRTLPVLLAARRLPEVLEPLRVAARVELEELDGLLHGVEVGHDLLHLGVV